MNTTLVPLQSPLLATAWYPPLAGQDDPRGKSLLLIGWVIDR
mgnify:CR=1 FL=1